MLVKQIHETKVFLINKAAVASSNETTLSFGCILVAIPWYTPGVERINSMLQLKD